MAGEDDADQPAGEDAKAAANEKAQAEQQTEPRLGMTFCVTVI